MLKGNTNLNISFLSRAVTFIRFTVYMACSMRWKQVGDSRYMYTIWDHMNWDFVDLKKLVIIVYFEIIENVCSQSPFTPNSEIKHSFSWFKNTIITINIVFASVFSCLHGLDGPPWSQFSSQNGPVHHLHKSWPASCPPLHTMYVFNLPKNQPVCI